MASLKYLDAAKNDLGEIARYITGESGSTNVAINGIVMSGWRSFSKVNL